MKAIALTAIWLILGLASTGNASASPRPNVKQLVKAINGGDINVAKQAAFTLAVRTGSAAAAAVNDTLRFGGHPLVLAELIKSLPSKQLQSVSVILLRHYANHRTIAVRLAAIAGIAKRTEPQATDVLVDALGDSSPKVREAAAVALGQRRERNAEKRLYKLLRRGDPFVAVPLGLVASAETADALVSDSANIAEGVLSEAFGEMLTRVDFGPDQLRLRVVQALGGIPTVESTAALMTYVASVPDGEKRESKELAEKIVEGREGQ